MTSGEKTGLLRSARNEERGGTRLLRLLPRLVVVKNKKERIFLKKWSENAILKVC